MIFLLLLFTAEPVTFTSPTQCEGRPHGVYRWQAKIDQSSPPQNPQPTAVIPSDLAQWPRLSNIKADSKRLLGSPENQWYELTGVVVLVKLEDDGDIHVQLQNEAHGDDTQVVIEIPLGPPWDALRHEVCSWSTAKFPRKPGELKLRKKPVIRVVGKGFWDGEHASKEGVMRNYDKKMCTWEIHPAMKMTVLEHEIK